MQLPLSESEHPVSNDMLRKSRAEDHFHEEFLPLEWVTNFITPMLYWNSWSELIQECENKLVVKSTIFGKGGIITFLKESGELGRITCSCQVEKCPASLCGHFILSSAELLYLGKLSMGELQQFLQSELMKRVTELCTYRRRMTSLENSSKFFPRTRCPEDFGCHLELERVTRVGIDPETNTLAIRGEGHCSVCGFEEVDAILTILPYQIERIACPKCRTYSGWSLSRVAISHKGNSFQVECVTKCKNCATTEKRRGRLLLRLFEKLKKIKIGPTGIEFEKYE